MDGVRIAAGSLVLIKEDLIPLLTGFGAYLFVRGERRRGAVLVAASLLLLVAVIGIIVPAFNDAGQYEYTSAFTPLMREPWRIPVALVTPPVKLGTAFLWLAPFLFLPLASPLILIAVPLMVERFPVGEPESLGNRLPLLGSAGTDPGDECRRTVSPASGRAPTSRHGGRRGDGRPVRRAAGPPAALARVRARPLPWHSHDRHRPARGGAGAAGGVGRGAGGHRAALEPAARRSTCSSHVRRRASTSSRRRTSAPGPTTAARPSSVWSKTASGAATS